MVKSLGFRFEDSASKSGPVVCLDENLDQTRLSQIIIVIIIIINNNNNNK